MKERTKLEDPIEAKHAIAEVFSRLGGVAGMLTWAKNHRAAFYSLYTKLIPLEIGGQVSTNVEANDASAALERILNGILAARQEEVANVGIDVTPTTSAPEPLVVRKAPPPTPPALSVVARDTPK
jgi:hypothetical protein